MNLGSLFSGALSGTAAAIAGAVGAVALTVLYLLRLRRREVVVPFAPFWLGLAGQQRTPFWARRLRHLVSLALAMTLFGLILLAARDPRPAAMDRAGRSIVILIDRSASMSARDEPGTRLGAARAKATAVVGGLASADRAMVASFAADAVAESGFEADAARLRRAIAGVTASEEPGDLPRALAFATAVLRGRPRPTLVIVSDGGFSDDARRVDAAGGGAGAGEAIDVRFAPVGRRAQNVGIVSFAARRVPADPGIVDAALVVQSFAAKPVQLAVDISAGGATVERVSLTLAPGERRRHALGNVFAPDARLEAKLVDMRWAKAASPPEPVAGGSEPSQGSDVDDGRPLAEGGDDDLAVDDRAFAVVPPMPRRRVLRVGGADLYLDGALLSLGRTVTVERATLAAAERDRARWGDYDLVIFDGVTPAAAPTAGRYLYLDPHGAGNPFGERGSVRDPVLGDARRDHALLRQLDLADVNIAEARRLVLTPGDTAVAGSFGVPLIVARDRPGLRIAATSFSPRRSDMPMRPAFPLFVANVLAWMGTKSELHDAPAALTGTSLRVRDDLPEIALARTGFHAVGDEVVAANLGDARESDTTPAPGLALGGRTLAAPDPPIVGTAARTGIIALWVALALLLFEWVSYHRRWTT
jgi:hypothetical protein